MSHVLLWLVLAHVIAGLALVGWAVVHFRKVTSPPSPVLTGLFWLAMTSLFVYPLLQ